MGMEGIYQDVLAEFLISFSVYTPILLWFCAKQYLLTTEGAFFSFYKKVKVEVFPAHSVQNEFNYSKV